jgi:hypothetical protein
MRKELHKKRREQLTAPVYNEAKKPIFQGLYKVGSGDAVGVANSSTNAFIAKELQKESFPFYIHGRIF